MTKTENEKRKAGWEKNISIAADFFPAIKVNATKKETKKNDFFQKLGKPSQASFLGVKKN